MAIPTSYLTTAGSVPQILDAMQKASVPDKFTHEFLKQLGFPSSSARPVIGVLKALGFLTDSGAPTDRYRRYKDPGQSKSVMAEGLREAYADVFGIDQKANQRNAAELKGIFARLSDKGDSVNEKMALTFKTFANQADFDAPPTTGGNGPVTEKVTPEPPTPIEEQGPGGFVKIHHDVHIHLPETTDIKVYDAIFRSIRENLQQ